MNKKRLKALKQAYVQKHGKPPGKITYAGGKQTYNEWRAVKKHWLRTGEVL